MLYIGCIAGIVLFFCLRKAERKEDTKKKITGTKIIVFLLGIMILAEIAKSKIYIFGRIEDIAFIILIILLGYGLFKKLFMS